MTRKSTGAKSNKGLPFVGRAFLVLFCLPFLGFGCFMGYRLVLMLGEWNAAQDWIEKPARLVAVSLKEHRDNEGGSTSEVVATYEYEHDGRRYTGEHVGLSGDADNLGSWQEDMHARLKAAMDKGETVPCYVDPSDPATALLDRGLRYIIVGIHLVFVLCFGGVGGALLYGVFRLSRPDRARQALKTAQPDKPWMTRPDWASGVISPKTGTLAIGLWIAAVFWNSITSIGTYFITQELFERGNWMALLFLPFPVVGVYLLSSAVQTTRRHRRFGRSRFELKTLPGLVGGRLRGDLVIVGRFPARHSVDVALECRETRSSGRNEGSHTVKIWSEVKQSEPGAAFSGRARTIPVDFQIPYDCRPLDDAGGGSIHWFIRAVADIPGIDLGLEFEVPVYKTTDSDASIGRSDEAIATEARVVTADESPLPGRMRRTTDASGRPLYVISALPGWSWVLFMLPLATAFGGVSVVSLYAVINGTWAALCGVFGFGFFAMIMAAVLISFIGSYRVQVADGQLTVHRRYFLFGRTRSAPLASIKRFSHKSTASSGSTKYYTVYAHLGGKDKLTLTGSLRGETSALWFIRQLEQQIPGRRRGVY